jgi:hypothetical protein
LFYFCFLIYSYFAPLSTGFGESGSFCWQVFFSFVFSANYEIYRAKQSST